MYFIMHYSESTAGIQPRHGDGGLQPLALDSTAIPLSEQVEYSSEMVAPQSGPPPTRFTAKWGSVMSAVWSRGDGSRKRLPRAVQVYYKKQKKDMEAIAAVRELSPSPKDTEPPNETSGSSMRKNRFKCSCIQLSVDTAVRLTLATNFLLVFFKLAATIQSGSLAVLSSLIDSGLDLFSGAVIAVTSYLIRRYDRFHYPIGRNRLEPVAIIVIAAVMGTATLQVISSAIEDIAANNVDPQIDIFSGTILAVAIVLKGFLYILCRQVNNPSVEALAIDHRNDMVSNIAALVFGLIGTYVYNLVDPIGAILLSVYIIVNWILAGYAQLKNLVGHTADRRFLSKLTWIAVNHDERIVSIDTVRAYTFGINYLVELHIQLPPNMPLQEAHDIGESLQQKIESLDEIERAFVHLDHETEHNPLEEHKFP